MSHGHEQLRSHVVLHGVTHLFLDLHPQRILLKVFAVLGFHFILLDVRDVLVLVQSQ